MVSWSVVGERRVMLVLEEEAIKIIEKKMQRDCGRKHFL